MSKKKEIVKNDNSEGYIPDYTGISQYNSNGFLDGKRPTFDTKKALKIIKNDPVVKGAVTTIVDKVLESGWRVKGKDKRSRIKSLETKLKELRFNKVLRKFVFNLILYNNAFIEIIKKGDEVTDLNVLENNLMEIDAEDNGDINGFFQDVGGANKDKLKRGIRPEPYWKPEQILFSKLREITNNVWAEPLDMEALYETALIKDYIRQWLMWFFGTNQKRGVFAFKSGVAEKNVKDFMSMIKASEKDKTLPVVLQGELVYQFLNNFDDGDKILDVLKWCDEQILILLQLPPIAVGMPDNSGRSNSVEQYQALNTTVHSIHQLLEDDFTYDLFKKIGFQKAEFEFGILDHSTRMKGIEMMEKMVNMRMTEEAIKEFADAIDLAFDTDKLFKDDPVELGLSNKDVGAGNEGQLGNVPHGKAPSRKGQPSQQLNKANQKEMVKNSEDKYSKYPYTYEVPQ